jgi:hypothetical protein
LPAGSLITAPVIAPKIDLARRHFVHLQEQVDQKPFDGDRVVTDPCDGASIPAGSAPAGSTFDLPASGARSWRRAASPRQLRRFISVA